MKNKIYIIHEAERSSEIKGMRSIANFLKKEFLLLSNIEVVA